MFLFQHYKTITLNSSIEHHCRQFIIPFTCAKIKYIILGTPYFEKHIQNVNIQDFTLHLKYQPKDQPNITNCTSQYSKDYPYFSYIYRINSRSLIRLNPNSLKLAHSAMKNYYNLHITSFRKINFSYITTFFFSTKFRTTFNFIEVFTDNRHDFCSTIIQNSTNRDSKLPTRNIGYIEVSNTNEKPKCCQFIDISTLVHNVAHTHHPDLIESFPPSKIDTPRSDSITSPKICRYLNFI